MAKVGQGGDNTAGDLSVSSVFSEFHVGAALARSVHPMTVVDKVFHSWFCVWAHASKLHKISEKSEQKRLNRFNFQAQSQPVRNLNNVLITPHCITTGIDI